LTAVTIRRALAYWFGPCIVATTLPPHMIVTQFDPVGVTSMSGIQACLMRV